MLALSSMKMRKRLFFTGLIIMTLFLIGIITHGNTVTRLDGISSNLNPLIRHFSPTWRSLKKITDFPYLVRVSFRKSTLPIYKITLTQNDRLNLINNLPNYPEENRLYEEFKKTVKAEFRHGTYTTANAKIRYRGNSPNHWNALKKSWHVQLPIDAQLDGRRVFRFFIGEDKGWIKAMLWNHLGNKHDVLTLQAEPVRLYVNKKDMGVYILIEGWEELDGRVFSVKNIKGAKDRLTTEAAGQWYDRDEPERSGETYPELMKLLALTAKSTKQEFEKEIGTILDTDVFLRWTLLSVLSGNFHQGNYDNLNFFYNEESEKFEPVFFDAHLTAMNGAIDLTEHRIVNRLIASEAFRERFEDLARSYVLDIKNLEDDLAFYDEMTEIILPEIYSDTSKIQTSFEAQKQVREDREIYKHNFLTLQSMLKENNALIYKYADEMYPL